MGRKVMDELMDCARLWREIAKAGGARAGIPFSNCRTNSRTADIFVLGFHSLSRSMPKHIVPLLGGESLEMFGW